MKELWTIGHSTHSITDFCNMLQSVEINLLADVRRFPGSRRYPHFNPAPLQQSLFEIGISYKHFPDLGGRRNPNPDSVNTAWRVPAFRGYADYMETEAFKIAVALLMDQAKTHRVAIMCAEAPWWKCHRALISDYLKSKGWIVKHIMGAGKTEEHPYTKPASLVNGKLDYTNNGMRF